MHHLKRKAMKRDTIIIEDKAVSVTGNDVWMTATEIAGLFHTTVPAVNAAIRAVRKSDVLNDYEVCRYMQLENGCTRTCTPLKSSSVASRWIPTTPTCSAHGWWERHSHKRNGRHT